MKDICESCLYKQKHGHIRCFDCKDNPDYQYNITPILITVDEYHNGLITPKELVNTLEEHIEVIKYESLK